MVSESMTRAGPPTEMVWPRMEKALSPAEAVKVCPSMLNSMFMPVLPVPLVFVSGVCDEVDVVVVVAEVVGSDELSELDSSVVFEVEAVDVVEIVSARAVYDVSAGAAGVVVAGSLKEGVGVATAVPSTKARGGSKTKLGRAASHMLQVDHAGTKWRTSVGMARMGLKSDHIVEHWCGGVYLILVPLCIVHVLSVLQRFMQL